MSMEHALNIRATPKYMSGNVALRYCLADIRRHRSVRGREGTTSHGYFDGRFNFSSESLDSVFPEALNEMATVNFHFDFGSWFSTKTYYKMTTLGFSFRLWGSAFNENLLQNCHFGFLI